jgi:hypothetical protein
LGKGSNVPGKIAIFFIQNGLFGSDDLTVGFFSC